MAVKKIKPKTDDDVRVSFGLHDDEPRLSDVAFDEDGVSDERRLLCGVTIDGARHSTFTFREMTGADEEAISKGEVRNNPAKIYHVLLERCVRSVGTLTKKDLGPRAWSDLMRNLYVGDQDWIMFTIRAASLGREFKVSHVCPNADCKAKLTTFVDVDEIGVRHFMGSEELDFELPKGYRFRNQSGEAVTFKQGKLRLSTGADREVLMPVFRKNPGLAKTMMLTRLVSFSDENAPPVTDSMMKELTTGDRNYLTELLQENDFGLDGTISCVCDTCGEEFQGDLTGADFLS